MKRSYISTIVKSFIVDNNLTENSYSNIYEYIIDYIEEIKVLDFGLYHIITDELDYMQQQKLIYLMLTEEYILDDSRNIIIESPETIAMATIGAFGMVGMTLAFNKFLDYIDTTSFFRLYEKPINKLNKIAEKTYNFLFKDRIMLRKTKLAQQILLLRSNECSKLCGVETDDQLSKYVKNALFKKMAGTEDIIQANCLLKCHIKHHIEIIILSVQKYRQCLKIHSNTPIPPLDNITALISKSMITECNALHNIIKKHYEIFEETLTILTSGTIKADYLNVLNKELLESSKTFSLIPIQNKQVMNKYKKIKGPFNKKNFKRF